MKKKIPNFNNSRKPSLQVKTRVMTEAEIAKIKEDAVEQAIKILEKRDNLKQVRDDAYDEAIVDATKYFVLCGCKVLHEQFGFGYKRLARFVDAIASLEVDIEENKTSLDALEEWLGIEVGMILSEKSMDEALSERREDKNETD